MLIKTTVEQRAGKMKILVMPGTLGLEAGAKKIMNCLGFHVLRPLMPLQVQKGTWVHNCPLQFKQPGLV